MYGTVARITIKPGMEQALEQLGRDFETQPTPPGMLAQYVYRLERDPSEYVLVVVFASKEAYIANASSPEQDARYRQFRSLLAADPEWLDGTIVQATGAPAEAVR
jgi:quinol monooxygenase YgiN